MAMHTDDTLLTLVQWLSPAYPVGAFAYSHGLEWAVQAGDVTDAEGFQGWIATILSQGAGRNDAILLGAAYRAGGTAELGEIDQLARALGPSTERRMEADLQGAAFGDTTAAIWGQDANAPRLVFPVAVGAAAARRDIPLEPTAQIYLHAFASNLTSAATRLIPLGQTEAQSVLAALAPLCRQVAAEAAHATLDDLGGCSFLADIASMKHETQYSRLFRS